MKARYNSWQVFVVRARMPSCGVVPRPFASNGHSVSALHPVILLHCAASTHAPPQECLQLRELKSLKARVGRSSGGAGSLIPPPPATNRRRPHHAKAVEGLRGGDEGEIAGTGMGLGRACATVRPFGPCAADLGCAPRPPGAHAIVPTSPPPTAKHLTLNHRH